jgi:prolipoprotein diacylglyceryltransferase
MLTKPKYHVEVYENGETYIRKPSFLLFADVILPCILLGQAIGR